jgi:hypothetical protein
LILWGRRAVSISRFCRSSCLLASRCAVAGEPWLHYGIAPLLGKTAGELPVGGAAGVGEKRAAAAAIETGGGLEQTVHRQLVQVIEGMGGAAGEIAG